MYLYFFLNNSSCISILFMNICGIDFFKKTTTLFFFFTLKEHLSAQVQRHTSLTPPRPPSGSRLASDRSSTPTHWRRRRRRWRLHQQHHPRSREPPPTRVYPTRPFARREPPPSRSLRPAPVRACPRYPLARCSFGRMLPFLIPFDSCSSSGRAGRGCSAFSAPRRGRGRSGAPAADGVTDQHRGAQIRRGESLSLLSPLLWLVSRSVSQQTVATGPLLDT
jgi:hypothetical protein